MLLGVLEIMFYVMSLLIYCKLCDIEITNSDSSSCSYTVPINGSELMSYAQA